MAYTDTYPASQLSEHLVRMTGYEDVARAEQLIAGFEAQEIAVHGIRRERNIGSVLESGVVPNCPDVTPPQSFWTSHERIFFSGDPSDPANTLDTSFFHYAHATPSEPGLRVMAMALTTKQTIKAAVAGWNERSFDAGYFSLDAVMGPDAIQVVVARQSNSELLTPRENGQLIECRMLEALASIAIEGIHLGSTKLVEDPYAKA